MGMRMGMLMVVGIVRMGISGTALAVDPPGIAGSVMLLLPDRHAVLHLVDDVPARAEGFIAMRCGHSHPDGNFPQAEITQPVDAQCT